MRTASWTGMWTYGILGLEHPGQRRGLQSLMSSLQGAQFRPKQVLALPPEPKHKRHWKASGKTPATKKEPVPRMPSAKERSIVSRVLGELTDKEKRASSNRIQPFLSKELDHKPSEFGNRDAGFAKPPELEQFLPPEWVQGAPRQR